MAEQFYSILTSIGKAKIANASVFGTKLNLTTLALGDGNGKYYNPTENQEALVNEVWRGNVGAIATDSENSNWIVMETMIAGNVGGFFIREVGVLDDEGSLIAIGKYPETYKPIVSDGATKDLIIRMILEVDNASSVTLKIDPTTVIATKKDIEVLDNKIKNIKIPVTKVNNKLGDVTLKAEDIKANNDKTIEKNLQEVTSQMAEMTKEIENIDLSANKVKLNKVSGMNATEVQTAIQELFQFADNGKKNMATVIGSPLSSSDTFDSMKSKIQTMKNTFASNLTAKGQSSSGSDTLNNLINKIPNINVGKKWATGTATMGEFVINVTGLQFRPTVIVTLLDTLSDNRFGGIYVAENIYGNTTRMNITFEIWNEKINTNTFDVSTNGFSFKTVYYWYGDALRWIAFE